MATARRPTAFPRAVLTTLLVAVLPLAGHGQESPVGLMEADAEMVQRLFAPRGEEAIAQELQLAEERLKRAEAQAEEFRRMRTLAAGREGLKKKELALLKDRRKMAKTAGDATQLLALDQELKRQGAQLEIFSQITSTAQLQERYSTALEKSVKSMRKVREIELDIAKKREERTRLAGQPTVDQKRLDGLDGDLSSLVRKFSAAVEDYAAANDGVSRALRDVVKSRVRLLDTWERANARRGLP